MTEQTTMDNWDDIPMYDPRATWPKEASTHPLRITEVTTKMTEPKNGATKGWEIKKIKFEVANGDLEGKPLFMDLMVSPATDANGQIVPNPAKVEQHQADGLSYDEAFAKAQQGVLGFARGEVQKYIRLLNAAGFIREKDIVPGDKNMRRIDSGLNDVVKLRAAEGGGYEIVADDGTSTGTRFTDDMLVSRIIMGKTAPEKYRDKDGNEKTGRKITKVWDYDPAEVGELNEATPV